MTIQMMYLECDLPEGVTLRDWRLEQVRREHRWTRRVGAAFHRSGSDGR